MESGSGRITTPSARQASWVAAAGGADGPVALVARSREHTVDGFVPCSCLPAAFGELTSAASGSGGAAVAGRVSLGATKRKLLSEAARCSNSIRATAPDASGLADVAVSDGLVSVAFQVAAQPRLARPDAVESHR